MPKKYKTFADILNSYEEGKGYDVTGLNRRQRKDFSNFISAMQPETEAPLAIEDWMLDENVFAGKGMSGGTGGTEPMGSVDMGLTAGDVIGLGGTIAGAITQISNSISAAKATKPNVNRFKGFNEKSLRVNRQMQNDIAMLKDINKRETKRRLDISKNTTKERNRSGATGISQLRSLDLATDVAANESEIGANNQIDAAFVEQMMNLKGQESALLSQQDQVVMGAEREKDIADQQDRDNAYTQYAQNLATLTESMQYVGANINKAKERNTFLNILGDTNAWGIEYDMSSGTPLMRARRTPSLYQKNAGTSIRENGIGVPNETDWTDPSLFEGLSTAEYLQLLNSYNE